MTNINSGSVRDHPVRFISWNVKSMNGPVKRSRVFTHLKNLKADIMFLQETHLKTTDHARLHKPWIGQVFHSNFNVRARGVAILVNKRIQFTASNIIADQNGRYIIVTGILYQTPVLLVNVYAPNWDDVNFMDTLFSSLPNLNTHRLIFGGDLNCVLNPALDRSSPKSLTLSKTSTSISTFMNENGCVDPWRTLNAVSKSFSFFSGVHHSFSRIDYFFIDRTRMSSVHSVDYLAIVISDHAPLQLDISFSLHKKVCPLWKFDALLLSDKDFCAKISQSFDTFMLTNKSDEISHSLFWETLKVVLRGEIISYTSHKTSEQKIAASSD